MDYNSIHGPGISNFSSPSQHRMPTVSAAQALQDLRTSCTRCISTGLIQLDAVLQNREPILSEGEPVNGGVTRGKVTEVYGPPGVGKTALGMQLAASVLYAGEGVVWVDASHPISGARFSQFLSSYEPVHPQSAATKPLDIIELASNFTHFSTPTASHLITLLASPTQGYPPPNTSLIIIDSFSTLITNAFPKTIDRNSNLRNTGTPNPSARKLPVLQYIINSLQKLAATRNIAIVIFSQCITRMRTGASALLIPAINTTAWEQGLGARVALFRDWGWISEDGDSVDDVRLAQVVKAEGVVVPEGRERLVGFCVGKGGLKPLLLSSSPTQVLPPNSQNKTSLQQLGPISNANSHRAQHSKPQIPQKRKLSAMEMKPEIPDSDAEDDEDYDWGEEDEEELPDLPPPPPPQWQGSEDILIPDPAETLSGEEDIEGDDELNSDGLEGNGWTGSGGAQRNQTERVIEDSDDDDVDELA